MTIYKKSKYNIIKDNYIYNLLKKDYIQVNQPLLDYIKKTDLFDNKEVPHNLIYKLKQHGIITDKDELSQIDYLYNSLKYDKFKASYIIYPTLSCNFSCDYCFETNKKGTLDYEKNKILKDFFLK